MRPKKRILIVDALDCRAGILLFQLEVKGYAVKCANSAEDAIDIAAAWSPELVLAVYPQLQIDVPVLFSALQSDPDLVTAVISNAKDPQTQTRAHAHLSSGVPMFVMLDLIKKLVARKRGPRKGSHHYAKAVSAAGPENADELRRIA